MGLKSENTCCPFICFNICMHFFLVHLKAKFSVQSSNFFTGNKYKIDNINGSFTVVVGTDISTSNDKYWIYSSHWNL